MHYDVVTPDTNLTMLYPQMVITGYKNIRQIMFPNAHNGLISNEIYQQGQIISHVEYFLNFLEIIRWEPQAPCQYAIY